VEITDDEDGDSLGDLVEDNPTLMGIYAINFNGLF